MANSRKNTLQKLRKKRGVRGTSSSSSSNKNTLQNQVSNYEARLRNAGVNPDDVTDTRNWLEKALNLEQDQNVLFDIFEILDRPRNALFTGVQNAIEGDNFLAGLGEGITGESKTTTKDILVDNLGMEDEEGKLDWADALGFVGDVVLDPIDWVLIPATGGGSLAVNAVDTAGDVAKVAKTASKVANVADTAGDIAKTAKAVKTIDKVQDISKGAKLAKAADATNSLLYNGGKNFTSASNILGKAVGKGFKKTAKGADNIITKALTKIDDVNLKRAQDIAAKSNISVDDAIKQLNLITDRATTYKNLKTDISKALDSSKNVKGLVGKSREADNISELEKKVGKETADQIREEATRIAQKMPGNIDENTTLILNNLTDAIESADDWTLKGSDVVKSFKNGNVADFYTPQQAAKVQKALRNYGIETTLQEGGRKLKLNTHISKLYDVQDAINDVKFGEKMSKETRQQLNNARKYFDANDELRNLYNAASSATYKQAGLSDNIRGLNTQNITDANYVRHNRNADVNRNKNKAFNTRAYDAPIAEVNAIKKAEFEAAAGKQTTKVERAKSSIYKTDDNGEIIIDKTTGKPIRDDNLHKELVQKKKEKIKKLQDEIKSAEEIKKLDITSENVKKLAKELDMTPEEFRDTFDVTKLTKKGEKAYDVIQKNPELKQMVEELENINFADINPEHTDVIDNLSKDFKDYVKTETLHKAALKKGGKLDKAVTKSDNIGYHYGDLGKGGDTNYFSMTSSRRSTGHFGHGTYFLGNKDNVSSMKGNRPLKEIDFSDYNLYKPLTESQAWTLHDGLKAINNQDFDDFNLKYLKESLETKGIDAKKFDEALEKTKKFISDNKGKNYDELLGIDSPSTVFMKSLGFDGVDVRGLDLLDNTTYGSVIYDLKPSKQETIKKLADSAKTKKKIVTADIKVAKNFADKEPAKLIKEANKAFKQGSKKSEALLKAQSKLEKNQEQIKTIFQSTDDTIKSLKAQLNYEKEALKKLEGAADSIFNKKLKTIDEASKAAALLSEESAKDFFVRDFSMNFIDYVNNQATWNKGAQIFNDALVTGVFSNNEYVKIADEIVDNKIPHNFTKVNGNSLIKKLDTYKGVLSNNSKAYANVLDRFKGKTLYMDKDLANILDVTRNTINNQVKPLLKVWDGINNTFKKFSTLTPGFHMRNIVGNSTNMVLSGMPSTQLPVYWKKAHGLWNNADNLMKKTLDGTLTAAEKADFDVLQDFYKAGFADNAFKKVQGLDTLKETKGVLSKASQLGIKGNEVVDRYNRLALMMYAKDNPKYLQKLGKKTPADAVRFVLFDPSNMSDAEKNVMKRIMPFYSFTKQNLMFQAENLLKNTPKYNKLYKFIRDAYNDIGEDSYYDYQRNGMQIPLPFTDDEGNQLFLKANLPVSDLGEWLENPIQRTVSSTAPAIKLPYEMATGVNTFTGEENYYKAGENFANALGITLPPGVNDALSTAEHILTGLGMQNVSSNVVRKVTALIEAYNGDLSGQQLWAELFRSILQNTNEENVKNAGLYEDLETYQNYVNQAKQQGAYIPTMTEINKANELKLKRMKRKRTMN